MANSAASIKPKIVVTGANGMVGSRLCLQLHNNNYRVFAMGRGACRFPQPPGFTYSNVDLLNENEVDRFLLESQPDILVHCAAMTQADDCELNQEKALAINVHATDRLLSAVQRYAQFVLYLSTDFVFDGKAGNYVEHDMPAPVNWYGHTKQMAEQRVQALQVAHAIVRTCLVYGEEIPGMRSNIIQWVETKLRNRERIKVVNDQFRTPAYVWDLVRGLVTIINKKAEGIWHLSGKDMLTPYDMAIRCANYLQLDASLIEPVDANSFVQPAKRPARTGFFIDKAKSLLDYNPLSFDEALASIFSSGMQIEK